MDARWQTWRGKQENIARFSSSTTTAPRRTSSARARSLRAFAANKPPSFYPAFGNNESRLAWLHRLYEAGCAILTIIHPTAYVSPTTQVEPGAVILPHAVVNTNCVVKAGCIVNCGAIVDHGCVLEEGVHICLGAIIKAENRIPRCMKIEAGEVVQNRAYPL